MRTIVLLLLLAITSIKSVHVEVSNNHIVQRLQRESKFLNDLVNHKWHELNHQDRVELDFNTLTTADPIESQKKAIDFILQGQASSQAFTATVHTKLIPSEEYDIYKNILVNQVEVSGVEDQKIKQDLELSVSNLTNALSDWTHLNLNGSSDIFYAIHLLSYIGTRIAGAFHTDGRSVFLEYSARDMHFSTRHSDPVENYSKLPKSETPRFLGLSLNDKFLQEFFLEFLERRKEINVLEFIQLFPDFDTVSKEMKVGQLLPLFPSLEDKYSKDDFFSLMINPIKQLEDGVEYANKNIKFQFKKDQIEILIPLIFDIVVHHNEAWDIFRQGFLGFGLSATLKQQEDKPLKFSFKANAGIKKLVLIDQSVEDPDDQNMEHESGAIVGLANLFLRKQLKPQTVEAPLHLAEIYPQFDVKTIAEQIKARIIPGFLDVTVGEFNLDAISTEGFDLVNLITPVSEGFHGDAMKKKSAYEKKQKRLEYQSNLQKDVEDRQEKEEL
ncbi:UNKNOWN [Stylonychia lemnae]|uniref:Uncharacterized protein n=1 Tax=Stylonychia lemnae TaxID=5949 RepID=A0A078B848_STYLE|nr:UNKNOWN [Stylonychia lemnae]|eukprot:CDW90574.1 UNKNOWN [Stylonychia lemnae]